MLLLKIRKLSLFFTLFVSFMAYCVALEDEPENVSNKIESITADGELKIVIYDRFDKFVPCNPYPSAIPYLQKSGIDLDALKQQKTAKEWGIEYGSLPVDSQFGARDGHFFVSTTKQFTMYGPNVAPQSRKYVLQLKISMPKDSSFSQSKVNLGIHQYGLYTGGPAFTQAITIEKGEEKTFYVAVDFHKDFPVFRPMIQVSGDITFEYFCIGEGRDDIVKDGMTLLEGTLQECSAIPDPQKSDYPDCRFVCHFEGNSVLAGVPCPQELSLVIEAFENYKLLGTNDLKAGDKVRLLIVSFEKLPDEQKTTQQADELNLFSLENYYVVGIYRIDKFTDDLSLALPASGIGFSGSPAKYISVFQRNINPPLTEDELRTQASAISGDLAEINRILAEYTQEKRHDLRGAFLKSWKAEQEKDKPGYNRINNIVWRNIDNSYWALPASYGFDVGEQKISEDKMQAILALHDFLEANGCQLIVSLVPNLYEISARVINKEFRNIPDFQTATIAKQLLENGIETVYASEEIIKNYNRYPFAFFYPSNGHPSDTTQDVLTEITAQKLTRYHFAETLDPKLFSSDFAPHVYNDDKNYGYPANCDIGKNTPGNAYCCRRVLYDGKVINPDHNSPVLVIGNSYIQTPMTFPDSFPTILSSKINIGIDSYRVGGYGPMTAIVQSLFSSPEKMLSGKKIVVLGIGTAHFLDGSRFNNIRKMDQLAMLLSGKTQKENFLFTSPIPIENTQYASVAPVTLFQIPQEGSLTIFDSILKNCNPAQEIVAIMPIAIDASADITLKINGTSIETPVSYVVMRVQNIGCKLPAGTTEITIEATGKPGTVFGIRNLSIFQ